MCGNTPIAKDPIRDSIAGASCPRCPLSKYLFRVPGSGTWFRYGGTPRRFPGYLSARQTQESGTASARSSGRSRDDLLHETMAYTRLPLCVRFFCSAHLAMNRILSLDLLSTYFR